MPSTFFGLTIAASGLNAYQTALNTTANNLSNLRTVGYTRQQANRVAGEAIRVNARYGTAGTGVVTTSITQVRNLYYDKKYWYNQASVGLYDTRLNYLYQIENYFIDDDTAEGFSTILNTMFNALDSMKNNGANVNVRQQFVGSAQNLATYFNSCANGLAELQATTNEEIKSTVQNINAIAEKIATLNKQINVIEVQGGYANELRDQRALLIDELSEIVPVEAEELPVYNTNHPDMQTGATYYTVRIGGQLLVNTEEYETLTCVAREERVNQSDIDGLYDIKWTKTGNTFSGGASYMSGSLRALFDIRDGNNNEYFRGAAKVNSASKITVTSPSITSVEAMTMPEEGVLRINGKELAYTGFTYETDADGNVLSYTFTLQDSMSDETRLKVDGRTAEIGTGVDSMGIPYYMAQMNQFLRCFTKEFNQILQEGMDLNGNRTDYYAFFTGKDKVNDTEYLFNGEDPKGNSLQGSAADSYYKLTAGNICVASICVKDPSLLGVTADIYGAGGEDAYELAERLLLLKDDTILYRGGTASGFLKCMISDISIDTQESKIFQQNFANIAETIDNQRQSISGVDEDEETLDLIRFQNGYNLSSKMISVMAEIYDRLILETGV